jgi:hypothetical protein
MTTLALTMPSRSIVAADLLKLRKRRGLVAVVSLMTVGAVVLTYGIIELLHVVNAAKHGPAGGIDNLGHGAWLAAALGAAAAVVVGSRAGVDDLDAGVYRELVVSGARASRSTPRAFPAASHFSCRSSQPPTRSPRWRPSCSRTRVRPRTRGCW